jgi:very-short-patch-repair endonuclease
MPIIKYEAYLKPFARKLRSTMTGQEKVLWSYLRRKQIRNIQFFRQKAIGSYIVDFYAPSVKLVIEIDGSQHSEPEMVEKDQNRDEYLRRLGLHILRFENGHVERCLDLVLSEINKYIQDFRALRQD